MIEIKSPNDLSLLAGHHIKTWCMVAGECPTMRIVVSSLLDDTDTEIVLTANCGVNLLGNHIQVVPNFNISTREVSRAC
jgi:hypothetical protein